MPNAALAFAANKRTGFPEAVTLNCLSEASPTKPNAPEAIIARPGLEAFANVGTAPIRGVFQKVGLLNDAVFIVALHTAYLVTAAGAVTTLTGDIDGEGLVEIDGGLDPDYNSVIRIANGSKLYQYVSSGTSVVQEDFPTAGGAGATSVAFHAGYWEATEAGSDAVYYIEPAGVAWNALQFGSAEYAPDPNVGIRVFGDLAAMLGKATTEFWRLTGDPSSPLEPAGGLKFDFGCRNIAAAVNCAGTLIWVDNNCTLQLSEGGPPSEISDNGLSEQIRRTPAADLSAGYFNIDQHPCYVLNLGGEATWVYDLSMRRWSRLSSLGLDYWRPKLFANIGDTILAADRSSNQLWRLDPDRRTDAGDVFTREFCVFIPVEEGSLDLGNIELDCWMGAAPATGQGSAPLIGMQMSLDEETYGPMRFRPLGVTGQRKPKPRWTALGSVEAPGVILKFQVSDSVGFRVSSCKYNVP